MANAYSNFKGSSRIQGIGFALAACFIWGWIFIIPQYMASFNALEIAVTRYFFYGLISLLLLLKAQGQGGFNYPIRIWIKAFILSFMFSIGYYTFVVLALRYSTPAVCALVLGISPISIAFYGNWKQRECSFKKLIFPSCLIFLGLIIINVPHLQQQSSSFIAYLFGICCSLVALASWTWYVVANARFLKKHPEVASSHWSTLLGVSTLVWSLILALGMFCFFREQFNIQKYFAITTELKQFLWGCALLGVFCSWIGTYLWNKASIHLPVPLAGQLTIFETIFGVCFIYLMRQELPSALEGLGMILFLAAIAYGIRSYEKFTTVPSTE